MLTVYWHGRSRCCNWTGRAARHTLIPHRRPNRARHLDDNHQNLVVEEQDEVKNWFESQMQKAKKFQPLAVLNQKLKGLDVFESNDAPTPPQSTSHSTTNSSSTPSTSPPQSGETPRRRSHARIGRDPDTGTRAQIPSAESLSLRR
jgi:hypothetical protein